MPRNAAVRRNSDASSSSSPAPSSQQIAVHLTQPASIAAWTALVERCGGAQAAFEALVLLPAALEGAGIDTARFLRACPRG